MSKINVLGKNISYYHHNEDDYISLTDMVKNVENGLALIEKWLRNKNTIEFLGIWEQIYNPDFNSPEFEGIKNQAGLNRFVLSVKQWVEKTKSKGIIAKAGRYGGTYAHKDIAFEFASWVSPAIKENLIPKELAKIQVEIIYATEADVLNMALFGMTAKQWRDNNHDKKGNIRDYADVSQLVCLANLESFNALFIGDGLPQKERLLKLNKVAIQQMKLLTDDRLVKKIG